MTSREKLDALDLVISALREHENTLDSLLQQMTELMAVMSKSMIKTQTLETKVTKLENRIGKNKNMKIMMFGHWIIQIFL